MIGYFKIFNRLVSVGIFFHNFIPIQAKSSTSWNQNFPSDCFNRFYDHLKKMYNLF